jgi:ferredoxin
MLVSIDFIKCTNCSDCIDACPENVFYKNFQESEIFIDNTEECSNCGNCLEACPEDAINIEDVEED